MLARKTIDSNNISSIALIAHECSLIWQLYFLLSLLKCLTTPKRSRFAFHFTNTLNAAYTLQSIPIYTFTI